MDIPLVEPDLLAILLYLLDSPFMSEPQHLYTRVAFRRARAPGAPCLDAPAAGCLMHWVILRRFDRLGRLSQVRDDKHATSDN